MLLELVRRLRTSETGQTGDETVPRLAELGYTAAVTDGRHSLAEDRSLALHRAVAERLRADPSLVDGARRRVEGWLREGTVAPTYAEAWLDILTRPIDEVTRFLEDPGERARRLRQTSPFAGVLDARTRWAVWRKARGRLVTP